MFKPRKSFLLLAAIAAFSGLIAIISVTNSPRFETIHRLDVIRLMSSGAGFGIAFMSLMMCFNPGPFSEINRTGEKSGGESN